MGAFDWLSLSYSGNRAASFLAAYDGAAEYVGRKNATCTGTRCRAPGTLFPRPTAEGDGHRGGWGAPRVPDSVGRRAMVS